MIHDMVVMVVVMLGEVLSKNARPIDAMVGDLIRRGSRPSGLGDSW
jgi:hypothetical protein